MQRHPTRGSEPVSVPCVGPVSAAPRTVGRMTDVTGDRGRGARKRFGKTQALDGRRPGRPAGHRARRARPQRRRQDHRGADPRHPAAGRRRAAPGSAATTSSSDADAGPPHHRADRPVRLGRRGPHRPAEPGADRHAARPAHRDAKARAAELLDWFDLADAADRRAKTYSGGMRRRLDLAASLVGRPAVIFLDEPTTGLDPAKREDMWEVVRRLVADGSTVLLTTQYLEEADALADEITVIDHGRVIAHDTPDGLKRIIGGQRIGVRPTDRDRLDDVAADPRRDRPARSRRADRPGRAHRRRSAGDEALAARRRPARRRRHRRHRAVPAPAEPGRGLPDPHRPPRRRRRHRHRRPKERGMTHRPPPPLGGRACRARRREPRPAPLRGWSAHVARPGQAQPDQDWRTPEALIDVTLQPIIFLVLFTYIFGGAIAGVAAGLPAVPAARHARPDHRHGRRRPRAEPEQPTSRRASSTGSGRCRSAGRRRWSARSRGRRPLLHPVVVTLGFGMIMGFRIETNPMAAVAGCRLSIAFALCFCWISVFVG